MNSSDSQPLPFTTGLRLRQLQLFVTVAETLSFSRAAAILYVSQPLISQQISELERQVGTPLFLRSRRSVQLTPAGEAMLREANSILQRASSAAQMVKRLGPEDFSNGSLNIGFEQLYRREAITQASVQFKMQHPNVSCTLSKYSFVHILSALNDGSISVGFLLLPPESLDQEFIVERLESDYLCLVAAKPLATRNTLEHFLGLAECLPICLLDKDTRGLNTTLRICCSLNLSPQFQFYRDLSDILMDVEAGGGVSLLPHHAINAYASANLAYYPLNEMEGARVDLAACWNKNRGSPLIPLFLEIYRQENRKFLIAGENV